MRNVLVLMGLLAILGLGAPAAAQTDKVAGDVCTLKVKGMACSACAARVREEAMKIDGVTAAKVDQPTGLAQITFDPKKVSPQEIAERITKITGFKAEVQESEP